MSGPYKICPHCNGKGKDLYFFCHPCNGSGLVKSEQDNDWPKILLVYLIVIVLLAGIVITFIHKYIITR